MLCQLPVLNEDTELQRVGKTELRLQRNRRYVFSNVTPHMNTCAAVLAFRWLISLRFRGYRDTLRRLGR